MASPKQLACQAADRGSGSLGNASGYATCRSLRYAHCVANRASFGHFSRLLGRRNACSIEAAGPIEVSQRLDDCLPLFGRCPGSGIRVFEHGTRLNTLVPLAPRAIHVDRWLAFIAKAWRSSCILRHMKARAGTFQHGSWTPYANFSASRAQQHVADRASGWLGCSLDQGALRRLLPSVFVVCFVAVVMPIGLSACSGDRTIPTAVSQPIAPAVTGKAWFACGSDNDCELVQDATCQFISVNGNYAADVLTWIRQHPGKRPFKCKGTPDQRHVPSTDYVPLCSDRECSVTLRTNRR